MAKKQKQWFSHDADAWDDPKIVALVSQYGMDGYGRWWRLLEILRNQEGYRYDIAPKFAYAALAKHLMCSLTEVKEFINDCVNEFLLLQSDEQFLWSESLIERMEPMDKKREKLSENGKRGAAITNAKKSANIKSDAANAENITANADQKVDKLYNIRVDNTKGDNSTHNKVELVGDKKSPTPTKEEIAERKEKLLEDKTAKFYGSLIPYANEYDKVMLREFFDYWREPTKDRSQLRWETNKTWDLKLRLKTWASKNNQYNKNQIGNPAQQTNKFTKSL